MVDRYTRKKTSLMKFIIMVVVLAIFGGAGFVFVSLSFEQNKPNIEIDDNIFWNLKRNLSLKLSDESGIKYYRVVFKDGTNEIVLENKVLEIPQKEIKLEIKPPKFDIFFKGDKVSLIIEAVDASKWNFFDGNSITRNCEIKLDTKKPTANVISNSLAIRRGGSAVVIAEIKDENLDNFYVSFNDKIKFKMMPFYKENYYISLIAWPVSIEEFKRVNLVAIDKASNIRKTKVPLYIRPLNEKNDNIKISKSFIENISTIVLEQSGEQVPNSMIDRFIYENRDLRAKNIDTIRKIVTQNMDSSKVDGLKIKPFKRLRGSRTVAGFAERRHYFYGGKEIDEAWHLGIDWASVKKASIRISNGGKVIFNDYLGIYGNSVIIDHKMGLATLYAHISTSNVNVGDMVKPRQKIANTGATGAVFGDHLHFGVLVQGFEVNPVEWLDKNWIKTRIKNVIKEAKKVIDSK